MRNPIVIITATALLVTMFGCHYGTEDCVTHAVSGVASCPMDVTAPLAPPPTAMPPSPRFENPGPAIPAPSPVPMNFQGGNEAWLQGPAVRPAAFTEAAPGVRTPPQPLNIPNAIPGSEVPPIQLPPQRPDIAPAQRRSEIESLFAEFDVVAPIAAPMPVNGQPPLCLAQLQAMALARSPLIRQAAADVESARGAEIQAGAFPNPHVGYQADTINTGRTGGYQGGNFSQTIVTGGKLQLARASANVDLHNAELALNRARYDLATQVRTNYLGVLVGLERIRVNYALAQFADNVYRLQVRRVGAGQAAAYEPLQLRVLAVQAQTQLNQSNHAYESAWRKLAATLNCPDMPPQPLAGRIDGPVPQIRYEVARDQILRKHTDLVTAQNAVARARYQVELARVTPMCPNIDTSTTIEHDFTTAPFGTTLSLQVGAPLPIFDNNRGNIIAAEGALVRASSEYERVRNDLYVGLADTYARYETNSQTAEQYRRSILADQVRAYRGAYRHYQVDQDADFNDVVTSQQTLAATISTYIQLLGDQWQAVADLAGLLQSDDIFAMGQAR